MNSISEMAAPARNAQATPSPVATSGLVVFSKTRPRPPVASRTARAWMRTMRLVFSSNAATPVGAFAREREPGALAIELSAPCDQLLDGGRTFFDQGANCFGIAEAVAGNEGVLLVQFDLIVVAESRSYASLRIFGGRFLQTVFGDDKHPAGRGELNCGAETCNAGPYDDVIRTDVFGSGDMSMIALREIRGMVLR